MFTYRFEIYTYDVGVTAIIENKYHITLDGAYAGIIFPEFLDQPPFLVWKTKDLIADVLVQKIGAAIQNENA